MLSSTYLEGSVSTSFANVVRDTCSFHLIESEEAIAAIAIAAANADDHDSEEWLPMIPRRVRFERHRAPQRSKSCGCAR